MVSLSILEQCSGGAALSCSWSKGSSSAHTTNLPEIGDSQASQVSYLHDLLPNLWAAPCKHMTPLEAVLTVVSASTDHETSFYNSQQQSHIVMLFALLGILWWVVKNQDDFFFCPIAPDRSKVHFCLCLLQLFDYLPLKHQALIVVRDQLMSKMDFWCSLGR